MASSSILQQSGIPAFLMDGGGEGWAWGVDDLMAAVLLGMPFPWADNIQLHILGRWAEGRGIGWEFEWLLVWVFYWLLGWLFACFVNELLPLWMNCFLCEWFDFLNDWLPNVCLLVWLVVYLFCIMDWLLRWFTDITFTLLSYDHFNHPPFSFLFCFLYPTCPPKPTN